MAEDCGPVNPTCWVADKASEVAGSVSQGVFEDFMGWLMTGFWEGFTAVVTAWVHVDVPDLTNPSGAVTQLHGWLAWLSAAVMIASLLAASCKILLAQNFRAGRDVLRSLLIVVFVSSAGTATLMALLRFGDLFAAGLIDAAFSEEFIDKITSNQAANAGVLAGGVAGTVAVATGTAGAGLLIPVLFGLVMVAAQVALMYFRVAALVVLAALLPLAAAGTATDTGMRWFQRMLATTFAFILYKPIAAICYAAGLWLMQEDTDGMTGFIAAVMLLGVAVLAMPVLVKMMAPVAASATGSGGGPAAAASVAAGAMAGPKGAAAAKAAGHAQRATG